MTRDEAFTRSEGGLSISFFTAALLFCDFMASLIGGRAERAGGSGGPAIFRISIADGRAAPDLNFKTLNRRPWL